ncbi:MAG: hypothetical protein K2V38_11165 [Gemmataceae bacterium]|nr:hypothetical protein [Gemmataceae bacterium]
MSTTVPADKRDLTQREVLALMANDRAVRGYALTALAGLAALFLFLYMGSADRPGSDIGAVLVAVFGVASLALRWTAGPPFLVVMVSYFALFPFGIPDAGGEDRRRVMDSHFQVADILLVMAVVVYLRAQYRVLGLVHQIVPFESALRRKGDAPTRRPPGHVRPDEIGWLTGIAFVLAVLGQLLWWLVNSLEFAPGDSFPVRWMDKTSFRMFRTSQEPGEFTLGQNRFFILVGGLFFSTVLARLVYDYWRLRTMGAAEGAMILTDSSWAESHRERVRVEKWRIWGVKRNEAAARLAEKKEKERLASEAKAREAAERRAAKDRQSTAKLATRNKRDRG